MMYQKGQIQVSRGGSFQRIAGCRQIRTKRGWIEVSSQRDKKGDAVDPLTICRVTDVNAFCHAVLTGQPARLFSISQTELIQFDGQRVTVCLGADRRLIPLARGTKTQKVIVRKDLIGNDSDEHGGYRMLYRTGSEKTPAVKIYWTTQ